MGVKSLWSLLTPVGRPVMLETIEGKALAIDSSIWIYQFQATMRDKDGRALVNAHVLGFLRRICKLLFYGIRPVFVFDGGAPALKRVTVMERKKKKAGAAASHAKLAEKLLAAQMRREALNHGQPQASTSSTSKGNHKAPAGPIILDDTTVYLEDIDNSIPKPTSPSKHTTTPDKGKGKEKDTEHESPSSSSKKKTKPRFHEHDPYLLPPLDLSSTMAAATNSAHPDPRLATSSELLSPTDLQLSPTSLAASLPLSTDLSSTTFHTLPPSAQYAITSSLRLKSRQTSYKRLQHMLDASHTPLDFSQAQIRGLRKRNELTQRVLSAVNGDGGSRGGEGRAVRVAGERNREYVLVRDEGVGGWVLGLRDDGTRDRPIEVGDDGGSDDEAEGRRQGEEEGEGGDEDSEMEMEEVKIPATALPDPDLRTYQRELALSAINERVPAPKSTSKTRPIQRHHKHSPKPKPLFDLDGDDADGERIPVPFAVFGDDSSTPDSNHEDDGEDPELAFALQASLDHALSTSTHTAQVTPSPKTRSTNLQLHSSPSTSGHHLSPSYRSSSLRRRNSDPDDDDDDLYAPAPVTRLETALAFANAGSASSRRPSHPTTATTTIATTSPQQQTPIFGKPTSGLLSISHTSPSSALPRTGMGATQSEDNDNNTEEVLPVASSSKLQHPSPHAASVLPSDPKREQDRRTMDMAMSPTQAESDEEMEEITPIMLGITQVSGSGSSQQLQGPAPKSWTSSLHGDVSVSKPHIDSAASSSAAYNDVVPITAPTTYVPATEKLNPKSSVHKFAEAQQQVQYEEGEEALTDWSRSPSPIAGLSTDSRPQSSVTHETWDAAHEMDPHAEEGEFARFMSQVKGRDLEDVRAEIDEEIKNLNQQKKAAMRDSEDITQQMISQIMLMLRLFGIPYITAPMEAEAQCAELVSLGLVEGIITDDSDVFLFGGLRVFKNMFNQSKTVECFLLSDLGRELGLERDTLVRLAYLLGSDYVEGLPGVGPVVAMELLKEFPGEDGLHKFKDWWTKVQTGKDKPDDNKSKFRKRFKKKFKDLYLPNEWPNPAVRDAYYHPMVDESEEPFKWGMPDLDALRDFLRDELGWHQGKVDDLLLPIIQKMGKRGQVAALNKQGNLNEYFDVSTGNGTYAPRKRQAYSSKRLQQVVSEFRSERAKHNKGHSPSPAISDGNVASGAENGVDEEPAKKRRKTRTKGTGRAEAAEPRDSTRKATGRRGRGTSAGKRKIAKAAVDNDEDEYLGNSGDAEGFAPQLRPRPKPVYEDNVVDAGDRE